MGLKGRTPSGIRAAILAWLCAAAFLPGASLAQGLTGALIGTVRDAQGAVVAGAAVSVSSPALIGGTATGVTNEKGQLRFPTLPPGTYALDIAQAGFRPVHKAGIRIDAGATIDISIVLELAGITESMAVEGEWSHLDARAPGFASHFGPDDVRLIPSRRASMFDLIRRAPGISPTSPGSGTLTTVSAFGSGTNENQFLIDGNNFTCPCNGVARAEPGIDFIQQVQIQTVGASVEYGNVQGAVINVVTRQGGERFLYDASYYGQAAGLTSQPVRLRIPGAGGAESGYTRARYRDVTTNLGGPVVGQRLWFFAGYQHLRDYDSQPGTDPAFPRTYEQDKIFGKLTWKLAPRWQLVQSVHNEFWVNPASPTRFTPFEATNRTHAAVPAITFGHLTYMGSANTAWDVRVGRFVFAQEGAPSSGNRSTPSRFDRGTGVTRDAPGQFGDLTISRTTAKATLNHYRAQLMGADHQWKVGVQVERGEHHAENFVPGGVRFVDNNGSPFQAIYRDPLLEGGAFVTAAAFASDAITIGDRLTFNAGLRFDHSRAISQDLEARDADDQPTGVIVSGLGTMYTWNVLSPRLGLTWKATSDGRTVVRASYGRFTQGVLTGELAPFHPGAPITATYGFESSTGGYTRLISRVDPRVNLQFDPDTRAPRTDELSVGIDREVGRQVSVAAAYIRKDGANFIGWTDVGGVYREDAVTLDDGRRMPVWVLVNGTSQRRFLLTNPDDYSLTYDAVVLAVEKRRSHGWQASGSYTLSRASGLQPSSGTTAAGPQVSTVSPPNPITFGRDPNDLTHARGRLANDRPHMLRVTGSLDVPRSGLVLAANLQYFSGKPWAATTQILLPQGDQRVLLEPRGTRRLSSQTLLDVRLSRAIRLGHAGRVELILDVLNVLGDTAEEGLGTDNLFSATFAQPTLFMDPRRAMLSARLNLGR